MEWATEKPTKPGWYWWRAGSHVHNQECLYVVQMRIWHGNIVEAYTMDAPDDGEYAGPIEPPHGGAP
jgi:hypothetical protein